MSIDGSFYSTFCRVLRVAPHKSLSATGGTAERCSTPRLPQGESVAWKSAVRHVAMHATVIVKARHYITLFLLVCARSCTDTVAKPSCSNKCLPCSQKCAKMVEARRLEFAHLGSRYPKARSRSDRECRVAWSAAKLPQKSKRD